MPKAAQRPCGCVPGDISLLESSAGYLLGRASLRTRELSWEYIAFVDSFEEARRIATRIAARKGQRAYLRRPDAACELLSD